MAWTKDKVNGMGRYYNLALGTTLNANGLALTNAGTAQSDEFEVGVDFKRGIIGVTVEYDDDPANTNVVDLYASNSSGGTFAKVSDDVAASVAGSAGANTYTSGTVDLTNLPWQYFKIAITSTGNESSNHARVIVTQLQNEDETLTVGGIGSDPS